MRIAGKILALNDDGSALIELDSPINVDGNIIKCVIVICRHSGYDFYRLFLGFIAVHLGYLPYNNYNKGRDKMQTQTWFAIASMKLQRKH